MKSGYKYPRNSVYPQIVCNFWPPADFDFKTRIVCTPNSVQLLTAGRLRLQNGKSHTNWGGGYADRIEIGGKPDCVGKLHIDPLGPGWEQVGNRVEVSDVDMCGVICRHFGCHMLALGG